MLMDNLGYGDLGCFGSVVHRTPHVDCLAAEGMRLSHFYSTSGVCTPSRASLMTGCYPRRVNLHIGGRQTAVLMPADPKGLHPDEITMARLLKHAGYATACVGKWHLGDQPEFWPRRHGFDTFFGVPYSEDMVPDERHPERPPLPLMQNDRVIEAPVDRDYLTARYTAAAVDFIRAHRTQPFFLYLAHAMPGSTARPFASPAFQGRSANGPYGDAVEELDWSTGQIMSELSDLNLDDRTLVLWTSDNGAVRRDPPQGSNAPLRGWGYNTSEGGQRVPCIVRWPEVIPAGSVCAEVATMMDLFPTAGALGGVSLPRDRIVDGQNLLPLLTRTPGAQSQYDQTGFFYYYLDQLQAVRAGPWKLYLALDRKLDNLRAVYDRCAPAPARLHHLVDDPGEEHDLAAQQPQVVKRLERLAAGAREELGDHGREGSGQRPCGWSPDPQPPLRS